MSTQSRIPRKKKVCSVCVHPDVGVILEAYHANVSRNKIRDKWGIPPTTLATCVTRHHADYKIPDEPSESFKEALMEWGRTPQAEIVTVQGSNTTIELVQPGFNHHVSTKEGFYERMEYFSTAIESLMRGKQGVNDAQFIQLSHIYNKFLDLLSKWHGMGSPLVQISLTQSDEWQRAKAVLVSVLQRYPEAARAVMEALRKEGL